MERDHFKDRPESVQYNKNLYKGEYVFICLKDMQKRAKEIKDLTLTQITANLTSQWQHPRGQKIKGNRVIMDKYGNRIFGETEEVVGRCTYIVDDNLWSFDTSEGKKMLEYNGSKLVITPEAAIKGRIKIFAMLGYKRASIKIPLFRFMYFNDVNNVQDFINEIEFGKIMYDGVVHMQIDGRHIFEDDMQFFFDNKESDVDYIFQYMDALEMKTMPLEINDFILERIL